MDKDCSLKKKIFNIIQFELDKALARAHILEGLLIALDHIDEGFKYSGDICTDV